MDGGSSGHVAMHRRWALGSWETARGIRYALRNPASGWSVQDSVPDAWLGPVAMGPHGAALMTWVGPRNAVSNGRGSWFETHREDGQWSTPAVLVNAGLDASTAAITPDGSMTVAWSDRDGVHVMTRSAGSEWGEPQTLGGFGYNMEIATNHNGDMLLAWASDYNRARTAYRPAGGEWTVGPELRSPIFLYSIAVALNDNGQALLLWGRDTEEEYYVKRYLAWSMRSPDGTWSDTGYLDSRARANALGTNTLDVALNSHGRGLAVWDAEENGPTASHVARFNPIRGWTTPKSLDKAGLGEALLTETGDAVAALAVSPSGRRQFWWHQTAGERWRRHELDTRGVSSYGYGVSLDSAGQRMVMLSVNGTVVSRRLRVPLR